MPEGDTVLRTARRLDQALAGRPLVRAELRWPTLGEADLAGRTVTEVVAYGKQILTRFAAADAGRPQPRIPTVPDVPLTLRSHLRMEGRWYVHARDAEPWPQRNRGSVRAVLGGTEWTAVGTWLGLLDLIPTAAEPTLIGHLGPDIMADDFDPAGLAEATRRLAADPDAARRRRAARPDDRRRHRHHVHGRGAVRAEGLARGRRSARSTCRPCWRRPAGCCSAAPPRQADHDRQPAPGAGELGARPVRPALPALRDDRPGGADRPAAEGAARVLLPDLPAGTDADRRRQAAEPVGRQPVLREDRRPTGYRRR